MVSYFTRPSLCGNDDLHLKYKLSVCFESWKEKS